MQTLDDTGAPCEETESDRPFPIFIASELFVVDEPRTEGISEELGEEWEVIGLSL